MIQELDTVELTKSLPNVGLKAGDTGAVVAVYRGGEGYAVEFFDADGDTLAVVTVTKDFVRPAEVFDAAEHRA
jgi:hypothetical protein